jgi:methionine-rich copper-binding protein CopC
MRWVVLFALTMLAPGSPAFAHARLEHASPAAGSELAVSPRELVLTFTGGVEPLFSAIEVRDAAGNAVSTERPHVAPDNNRRLVIELPKLAPGTYTVLWHVTSVDTHKTEGSYKFTVAH